MNKREARRTMFRAKRDGFDAVILRAPSPFMWRVRVWIGESCVYLDRECDYAPRVAFEALQ